MRGSQADRPALIALALRLSWFSIAWAAVTGTASLAVGLVDHSLAIAGVGLNLFGDLAGSVVLVWRLRMERTRLHRAESAEHAARLAVGVALAVVAMYLAVQSVRKLVAGGGTVAALAPILLAAASVVVLPPLARAKRRTGTMLGSRALRGDGTLSGISAATALLALAGLFVNRVAGWWWADPAAALLVAIVAAVEARAVLASAP
jgi:divalent metal cation (Fe/Co/Zn/Cd) transporter